MIDLELLIDVVAAVAAVAVVGVVGLVRTIRGRPKRRNYGAYPIDRPRFYDGVKDVIDRSMAIYLLRRLSRRPTAPPVEPPAPQTALTADEVAYRIGVAGAALPAAPDPSAPTVDLMTGTAAVSGADPAAATPGASVMSSEDTAAGPELDRLSRTRSTTATARPPGVPRERLVRDSSIALLALALIGLAAVVIWPHGPTGLPEKSVFLVNGPNLTPGPTGEVDAATVEATAEASVEPGTGVAAPEPTPRVAPASAGPVKPLPERATPKATYPPTSTPTAGSKPTPKPTVSPDPKATPTPTPTPKPPPTPAPTPPPTPDPTPPPTPDPTPPPTPDPTPPPTPDPTPPSNSH